MTSVDVQCRSDRTDRIRVRVTYETQALSDDEAARTLKSLYPGREVIMLNVDPTGETGGGIYCAT